MRERVGERRRREWEGEGRGSSVGFGRHNTSTVGSRGSGIEQSTSAAASCERRRPEQMNDTQYQIEKTSSGLKMRVLTWGPHLSCNHGEREGPWDGLERASAWPPGSSVWPMDGT
jgi:hypothetical protein